MSHWKQKKMSKIKGLRSPVVMMQIPEDPGMVHRQQRIMNTTSAARHTHLSMR